MFEKRLASNLNLKVDKISKKLFEKPGLEIQYDSLENALDESHTVAMGYLQENGIKNFFGLKTNPKCFHDAIYTYSAFLNLVEEEEYKESVDFAVGYVWFELEGKKQHGAHAFLTKPDDAIYETVPINRRMKDKLDDFRYVKHMSFNPNRDKGVKCLKWMGFPVYLSCTIQSV